MNLGILNYLLIGVLLTIIYIFISVYLLHEKLGHWYQYKKYGIKAKIKLFSNFRLAETKIINEEEQTKFDNNLDNKAKTDIFLAGIKNDIIFLLFLLLINFLLLLLFIFTSDVIYLIWTGLLNCFIIFQTVKIPCNIFCKDSDIQKLLELLNNKSNKSIFKNTKQLFY